MTVISPVKPFNAHFGQRRPLQSTARFAGQESTGEKVATGSVLGGALSLLLALGTFSTGQIFHRKHEAPTKTERMMADAQSQLRWDVAKGEIIDNVSDSLKRGVWRFITGNRTSEERLAEGEFKRIRNAQLEEEDQVLELVEKLTALTGDERALGAMDKSIKATKNTRDEYYDSLEYLRTVDPEDVAGNFLTRLYKDTKESKQAKIAAAVKLVEENDRVILREICNKVAGTQQEPLNSAQVRDLYMKVVEKIVAKYAPEDVEKCQAAGKLLFQTEDAYLQGRLTENERRAQLNTYASGMGMFGVLALGLGLAMTAAANKRF